VEEEPRGDVAVRRLLLDEGARRQHRGLAHLLHRHAVVEVAQRGLEDRLRRGGGEALAGRLDQPGEPRAVERLSFAGLDHVDSAFALRGSLLRPDLRALLAVEHVGARDVVLAGAHQRELHLVLDVLDVEGAALRLAAHQRPDRRLGEPRNQLSDARRGGSLSAVHREERLGHGDADLGRLEADHGAVPADHLVLGIRAARGARVVRQRGAGRASRCGVVLSDLHLALLFA
jgi:hypothetical protein